MTTSIERIPTRISPDILDTIGKSFKFSHGKGIAEWLKNSLDQYLRLREARSEPRGGMWPVLVDLRDGATRKTGPNVSVVDFGGTTFAMIQEFFLHWGDKGAARHGGVAERAAVTGGHGNGGKFYMREMWRRGARFLTWRDGRATSLVVDHATDGTTGAWELKDSRMSWRDALAWGLNEREGLGGPSWVVKFLEGEDQELIRELDRGERGLSITAGLLADQRLSSNDVVKGGRWDHQQLVDEIRDAAQARRPISELSIAVFVNGEMRIPRLSPETIEDDKDHPPVRVDVPRGAVGVDELVGDLQVLGELIVSMASRPLSGRYAHYNAVAVLDGSGNPIASYPVRELPMPGHSSIQVFFRGEMRLWFPGLDSLVQNERERLVESPATRALLAWVGEVLWGFIREEERKRRDDERRKDLEIAQHLNKALNQHAQRFLREIQAEILVDFVADDAGGGVGGTGFGDTGGGGGGGGTGDGDGRKGGSEGAGGTRAVPGDDRPLRRPKYPTVLLSGIDRDPSNDTGGTKLLTEHHPPLYQDDVDLRGNVWWINTVHPFSRAALASGGPEGAPFKSYQLFMFMGVVEREALRFLQRRQAELALDVVENELSEVGNRFLAELPHELARELIGPALDESK